MEYFPSRVRPSAEALIKKTLKYNDRYISNLRERRQDSLDAHAQSIKVVCTIETSLRDQFYFLNIESCPLSYSYCRFNVALKDKE